MAKNAQPLQLRTRITGMQFIKGRALQDHTGNWRRHPQHQRDALAGILREIGVAGALLVYDSEKHGGLTVIDGHLRKGDFPEQEWPCLMTDLTDDEADYMLLVHDPLSAMALKEESQLAALLQHVTSQEQAVQQWLKLAERHSLPAAPFYVPALPSTETPSPYTETDVQQTAQHLAHQYVPQSQYEREIICPYCLASFTLGKPDTV